MISITSLVTFFTRTSGAISSARATPPIATRMAIAAIAARRVLNASMSASAAGGGVRSRLFEELRCGFELLALRCRRRAGLDRGGTGRLRRFLRLGARRQALRARRIAVIDLAAPALQIGVALEHVLV